jgi:hypothetical protein
MFASEKNCDTPANDGLEALSVDELREEIELRAARANADICLWLELVREFDNRSAWASWGALSCAHWLSWRCSLSLRAAREHVRVAHAVEGLPLIHAEFKRGALSYSKVRALTRVATPDSEEDLLQLAHEATAAQLDRLVRAYSRVSAVAAGEIHRDRYVSWTWENDGSLSLHANLSPEDGAAVITAIDAVAESLRERMPDSPEGASRAAGDSGPAEPQLPEEDGSAEPLRGGASRADALVAMATDALKKPSAEKASARPADRNMVVVHVDADELAGNGDGLCHLRGGSGLPTETARRLACDASVVAVIERGGVPAVATERSRSIPPSVRRAVEARDQGCRFPGCSNTRYTDAHHIRHWANGGQNTVENLILLCRRHHRLVHEGGYSVEAGPESEGTVVFRRPTGLPLEPSPAPPPLAFPLRAPAVGEAAGPLIAGSGQKLDLNLGVLAMIQIFEGTESRHTRSTSTGDPSRSSKTSAAPSGCQTATNLVAASA